MIGGFLALAALARREKIPILEFLDSCAPAACVGYAIGRIGCLLSGDGDYGIPTSLPWGMSFPNGVVPTTDRVHPTPLYEFFRVDVDCAHFVEAGKQRDTKRRTNARKNFLFLFAADRSGALSGGIDSHQPALVFRNVERASGECSFRHSRLALLVSLRRKSQRS